MPAVTELEIFTAVKATIAAANGNWLSQDAVYFNRRPPNSALTAGASYVVIAVEEKDEDPDVESDGAVSQCFAVEIAARVNGADDANEATPALVELDPLWTDTDAGIDLGIADHGVNHVIPRTGRLRLIEPLRSGDDQYTATRRWDVYTAALLGAN